MTDKELFDSFLESGNQAAFEALHDKYASPMRAFLTRCYPGADASEVIRQAFVELRERRERFDARHQLRPWLFTVAACIAEELVGALQSSCLLVI